LPRLFKSQNKPTTVTYKEGYKIRETFWKDSAVELNSNAIPKGITSDL